MSTFYGTTSFKNDIEYGKTGETIFKKDFLEFINIKYLDVTQAQRFRAIDSDYKTHIGMYEIKTNYKDDKHIIIEEYTNINSHLSEISMGWFYKSEADMLVFISKSTRLMILIPFTDKFKAHYESIKEDYELHRNRISINNGRQWQSAFRRIPLEAINGYFGYYRKVI